MLRAYCNGMWKLSLAFALFSVEALAQDLPLNLGKRVHLGVLFGTSMTDDVRTRYFDVNILATDLSWKQSGNRKLIVGPSFEFDLGHQFSIEADALYHPIEIETKSKYGQYLSFLLLSAPRSTSTWEFPVLAKKYFALHNWRPFIAAGPSFRYPGDLQSTSHVGVTAAAGAEFSWRKLRITPSVRYTRWGEDDNFGNLYRNQSALLVGFSF